MKIHRAPNRGKNTHRAPDMGKKQNTHRAPHMGKKQIHTGPLTWIKNTGPLTEVKTHTGPLIRVETEKLRDRKIQGPRHGQKTQSPCYR